MIICRKLYSQDFKSEGFIVSELDKKWFADKDYPTLYIAEIEKVIVR